VAVNIKMDLGEIIWSGMRWIVVAEDRDKVEGSCEHGNELSGSINAGSFLSSCTTGGLSRRAQFPGFTYLPIWGNVVL
jgi:hypothetical protein